MEEKQRDFINTELETQKQPIIDKIEIQSLSPKLQSKLINAIYGDKKGGWLGGFLGTHTSNLAMHIAFIICAVLLAIVIADFIRICVISESFDYELLNIIVPVITLTLGYIFGKSSNKQE